MKLFAHLLINQFGLDPRVVERGVRDTVLYGGSLVSNMLELQLAPEEILLAALSKRYGVPSFDLRELKIVARAALAVPSELMLKHNVIPLRQHGKMLELGVVDPHSRMAVAEVSSATGLLVKPFVVLESRLRELLEPLSHVVKPARAAPEPPRRVFSSAEETKKALAVAASRHDIGDIMLSFALRYFGRAIVFVHRKDLLINWRHGTRAMKVDAPGYNFSPPEIASLHLPLNQPSAFKTVVESAAPSIGPLPAGKVHDFFHAAMGGGGDWPALIAPVMVFGRVINVVFGDAAGYLPSQAQRADLMVGLAEAGDAYERLVRERLALS